MLSTIQALGYTAQLLKREADLYLGSAFQCAWLCERAGTSRRTSHTSICMEIRVVSMYFLCRRRALWTDKKRVDNSDCLGRNRETEGPEGGGLPHLLEQKCISKLPRAWEA